MKVLIVCSGNAENFSFKLHQIFVFEQIESIKKGFKIEYDTFFIKGKGTIGYLNNILLLRKKIKNFAPNVIHAHFGLSGLLACLQRKVPVIITFHGSDAYILKVKILSKVAAVFSRFNIFVSDKIQNRIKGKSNFSIIPCGIDLDKFYPIDMKIARDKLDLDRGGVYILFASNFTNPVKNSSLAFSAIGKLKMNIELIELKNRSRDEVNLLLNACNLLLLTSKTEGSPQIIKEAMACNCPIVATDVGDISGVISKTDGCYITSFEPDDVTKKVELAIKFDKRTNGREMIKHLDINKIAKKIFSIYKMTIS